ncbi:hypothetical protein E2C01_000231 [Portunus trituberculatus]|uniref:Uncharacterized protein n=1 Tax=Portunus trituberculatus TaxID=210409 RepID=A0A5B7CE47_PORTR|nr:hypothetical protein [Portunus trituberculatus]
MCKHTKLGAALVQWIRACFGIRGVSERTGSNPVYGLSVDNNPDSGDPSRYLSYPRSSYHTTTEELLLTALQKTRFTHQELCDTAVHVFFLLYHKTKVHAKPLNVKDWCGWVVKIPSDHNTHGREWEGQPGAH